MNQIDIKFYPIGGIESNPAEKYKKGRLVLTSHRLLWIDSGGVELPGRSCWIPLSSVESWTVHQSIATRLSLKQQKVKVQVYEGLDGHPAADGIDALHSTTIVFVFNENLPANFGTQLRSAMERKCWNSVIRKTQDNSTRQQTQPELVQQLTEMGFSSEIAIQALTATGNQSIPEAMDWALAFVNNPLIVQQSLTEKQQDSDSRTRMKSGIGGILRNQERQLQESNQSLDLAFQDLNGLMSKAQEMVKLAEKFRSSLSQVPGSDQEDLLDQEMITEMISMGITSPVTKETAGALYHEELSRQLADFLVTPLERVGGMMTLPDVYCRFNRGRGMELVSPDDLIQAASLFEKLQFPLKMRYFPSGVTVIQSAAHNDDEICQKIEKWIKTEQPRQLSRSLIASDLVEQFRIPLTIAQEHLLIAEQREVLCRDDSPDGIRFYFNFFKFHT
eukprot:g3979.t1